MIEEDEWLLLVGTASVSVVSNSLNEVSERIPELESVGTDDVDSFTEMTVVLSIVIVTSEVAVPNCEDTSVDRGMPVESGTPVERAGSDEGSATLELLLEPYGGG